MNDDIEWTEHPDQRFPARTVLIGKANGKIYASSFCGRREEAVASIRAAVSRDAGKAS